MSAAIVILALVTAQRLGELALAQRNTRRLLARGGVETGAEHYPLIVGLHAAWVVGLWAMAWDRPVRWEWVVLYLAVQALRVWTIVSLGERWTTRIITVPGEPRVRRGPYRFVRHPNYIVVAAEIAILPLAFDLAAYALVFSLLNASILAVRIRAEDHALNAAEAGD